MGEIRFVIPAAAFLKPGLVNPLFEAIAALIQTLGCLAKGFFLEVKKKLISSLFYLIFIHHKLAACRINVIEEVPSENPIGQIKEKIETEKNIISLKGEAGAVTAFLKAAESALVKASEIKEYFEEAVLNKIAIQKNGRWHVFEDFLATVRSELRSAYAVAVSA